MNRNHVWTVINSCAQTVHAIRILRSRGMDDVTHLPCRSYCKTYICICFQLLVGFHQCIWQRLEASLRRGRRYGLYPSDQPTT